MEFRNLFSGNSCSESARVERQNRKWNPPYEVFLPFLPKIVELPVLKVCLFLAYKSAGFEGIVANEAKPKTESLLFSCIRAGSAQLVPFLMHLEVVFRTDASDILVKQVELAITNYGPCITMRDSINFNTALHFAAVDSRP